MSPCLLAESAAYLRQVYASVDNEAESSRGVPCMPLLKIVCVALLLAIPSIAQEKQLHGIDPSDMDRKLNPCDNFFDYANGAWRANNPIPPSMVRWSKRWQSGETTKDTLRTILEESSAKKNPKGSTEQLIGDYYGSCMDEKKINEQGIKPLSA